jgi:hypothetical protein
LPANDGLVGFGSQTTKLKVSITRLHDGNYFGSQSPSKNSVNQITLDLKFLNQIELRAGDSWARDLRGGFTGCA